MGSPGVGGTLSSASDVNFNNPQNGDYLHRNSGMWVNGPLSVTADDVADGALTTAKVSGLDDVLTDMVTIDSLADSVIDSVTQNVSRVGLMIGVAYNDGGSSWPSVPAELLNNPNVCIHWVGGSSSTPPPNSSGPAIWDALA